MKIKNVGSGASEINQLNMTVKNIAGPGSANFKNQLENATSLDYKKNLIDLSDSILKQGDLITKKCDIKELQKYKELISEFFKEVVDSNFEFSKEGKSSGGRRKIYANIKKVNAGTEVLANELLKEQKDQVTILKTVEDIRGLILDTFM